MTLGLCHQTLLEGTYGNWYNENDKIELWFFGITIQQIGIFAVLVKNVCQTYIVELTSSQKDGGYDFLIEKWSMELKAIKSVVPDTKY